MGSTCEQGKANGMGTKKREGTALGRRRSKKRRLTLKGCAGWDRLKVACFQAGPAARKKEIFAGADLDLGWRNGQKRRAVAVEAWL